MQAERVNPLPGVRFLAEPGPAAGALPPMDVAAFVGFASRGPLHVPVAVEDAAQFRDVFGADLPLAWDGVERRLQHSLLGPSVELFFRNGGRRCWVVRVAQGDSETGGAQTQTFRVPGLYRTDAPFSPARVRARAPGAWAEALKVGARLIGRALDAVGLEIDDSPRRYRLRLAGGSQALLQLGDLLELRGVGTGQRLYLFVERLTPEHGTAHVQAEEGYWFEEGMGLGSPGPDDLPGGLSPLPEDLGVDGWAALGSPAPGIQVRLLRLELLAWTGDRLEARLGELGLDPGHDRYFGALPDDQALYRRVLELGEGALGLELAELWREARGPRFPLAGTGPEARYLPLGMSERRSPARALAGDLALGGGGLGVEGLAALSADLFLDPDLGARRPATLLSEAKHKRLVEGEPLLGIHSLMFVEEVSLMAVPDAGHRHWDRRPRPDEPPLAAPWLDPLGARDERGRRSLSWSAVAGARRYVVERSGSPEFEEPRRYPIEPPPVLDLADPSSTPTPATGLLVTLEEGCPTELYFRVRAIGHARMSAWSNTRVLRLPEGGFHGCARVAVETMALRLSSEPGAIPSTRRLVWRAVSPAGLGAGVEGFELQWGRDSDFLTHREAYRGDEFGVELALQPDLRAYYRVRALTPGGPGPWSNTVIVEPRLLSTDGLVPAEGYDGQDLLAVHCALVRLCGARADCLGLLSLPAHYRSAQVSAHVDALMPTSNGIETLGTGALRVRGLGLDEAAALSHASLFHPWIRHGYSGPEGGHQVETVPPDGVVLGALASHSLARGAWISPANEALFEVLGLTPILDEGAVVDLLQRAVNLLRPGPRGVVMAKADTLSPVAELRALGVRRFMHLLRRLILREGARYVFEPNSEDFRDAVRAQWEQLLLDLYGRGALRGAQPEHAYRVVVDPTGEGARTPNRGRLVIELRVAPAQPLRYIRVRLIQDGPQGLVVREV